MSSFVLISLLLYKRKTKRSFLSTISSKFDINMTYFAYHYFTKFVDYHNLFFKKKSKRKGEERKKGMTYSV